MALAELLPAFMEDGGHIVVASSGRIGRDIMIVFEICGPDEEELDLVGVLDLDSVRKLFPLTPVDSNDQAAFESDSTFFDLSDQSKDSGTEGFHMSIFVWAG